MFCFTVTFQIPADIRWIKVNAGQMGYYRVLYNEDNWESISEELKRDHGTFTALVNSFFFFLSENF